MGKREVDRGLEIKEKINKKRKDLHRPMMIKCHMLRSIMDSTFYPQVFKTKTKISKQANTSQVGWDGSGLRKPGREVVGAQKKKHCTCKSDNLRLKVNLAAYWLFDLGCIPNFLFKKKKKSNRVTR